MNILRSALAGIAIVAGLSVPVCGAEPQREDDSSKAKQFVQAMARSNFGELNTKLNGALTPLFDALAESGTLQTYFDRERNPKRYEAYLQFVIQTLVNAKHGDVGEAMFAHFIISQTPPEVLLAMIGPQLGPGERLDGILKGENSSVVKHLQRQSPQGHLGTPVFAVYTQYLKGKKDKGLADVPNAETIIDHLFQVDPQLALLAMLEVEFGFSPESRPHSYLHCGADTQEVKKLQLRHASIGDYLWRTRYAFPLPNSLATDVAANLRRLAEHEKWWVRLYVARTIAQDSSLRDPDVIQQLRTDKHELVRTATEQIAKPNENHATEPAQGKAAALAPTETVPEERRELNDEREILEAIRKYRTPAATGDVCALILKDIPKPEDTARYRKLVMGLVPPQSEKEMAEARAAIEGLKKAIPLLRKLVSRRGSIFDYPGLLARGTISYDEESFLYDMYLGVYLRRDEGREPYDFRLQFDREGRITKIEDVLWRE